MKNETTPGFESVRDFEERVLTVTGVALRDMRGETLRDGDCLPGPILAHRPADYYCRALFVCGVGYPAVEDDGSETYTDFVRVTID
jgi:hypothetical protein